jgi:hypothetical protein
MQRVGGRSSGKVNDNWPLPQIWNFLEVNSEW